MPILMSIQQLLDRSGTFYKILGQLSGIRNILVANAYWKTAKILNIYYEFLNLSKYVRLVLTSFKPKT